MKVIGTIGMNGAGKNTVIGYISKNYGIPVITISDLIRKVAATDGIEPTRENLTQVALDHIRKYGRDYFPRKIIKIIEQNQWERAGVAGIRSYTDVETFRKRFGEDFTLVCVDVPDPLIRFQRIKNRGEPRDPKTFDEFLEQDKKEEENFQLSKVIKEADYVLRNGKNRDALFTQIDKLLARILGYDPRLSRHHSKL